MTKIKFKKNGQWESMSNGLDDIWLESPMSHNCFYRGADLTADYLSGALSEHIRSGTFENVYPGDYFKVSVKGVNGVISGSNVTATATAAQERIVRIMHLDKQYRRGDTELTTHHVVCTFDYALGTAPMNATNVTTGGFHGSAMKQVVLPVVDANLTEAFGSHVLTYRTIQSNAVTNGQASGWAWYSVKSDLFRSSELFGTRSWGDGYDIADCYGQLAAVIYNPVLSFNRETSWLADVASSAAFVYASNYGTANNTNASFLYGVRPRFLFA